MGYAKKEFSGEYLNYYNIISSHGVVSVKELNPYEPVVENIRSLYWEGNCRATICHNVTVIDDSCSNTVYKEVMFLVRKTRIVYEILYPELKTLKQTIELYNNTIDEIAAVESEIAAEKAKMNGGS